MFWTWFRTVTGLTCSFSAIARVLAPPAIRRRISSSRHVARERASRYRAATGSFALVVGA
jgi:hypothetical protein